MIKAGEMKFMRNIAGKTRIDRVRNEDTKEIRMESLRKKVEKGRSRWLEHVKRMDTSRILRMWAKEGKRPRGCPRKRQLDDV